MSAAMEKIFAQLKEWGASSDPELNVRTKALFAPLIDPPGGGVSEASDIAYGDDPRQKLDTYHINDGKAGKTIVVFIPGGGFVGGDKKQDAIFFSNIGRFFARQGMIGICANYRLAPANKWPAGSADVKGAVRWARANAAKLGGDANKVVVFGHSAGAAHVASYLFDPDLRGGDEVLGGIVSSGMYALRAGEVRANVAQYFGEDPTTFERRSAMSHVGEFKVPVFVSCAEFDPPFLAWPAFEMAAALTRRDRKAPMFVRLDNYNHFTATCTFGTEDRAMSGPVLKFIKSIGG